MLLGAGPHGHHSNPSQAFLFPFRSGFHSGFSGAINWGSALLLLNNRFLDRVSIPGETEAINMVIMSLRCQGYCMCFFLFLISFSPPPHFTGEEQRLREAEFEAIRGGVVTGIFLQPS